MSEIAKPPTSEQLEKEMETSSLSSVLQGYQLTATFIAAIELDIFTAIDEGSTTLESIATRCDCSRQGTKVILGVLVILNLVNKNRDEYQLTHAGLSFSRHHPNYEGDAIRGYVATPRVRNFFCDPGSHFRRGGCENMGAKHFPGNDDIWVGFARERAPYRRAIASEVASRLAGRICDPKRVLDVAASHGAFGIEIARRYPSAAIFALDIPAVLDVTREHAAEEEVDTQMNYIPGDVRNVDIGNDYDLIFVTGMLEFLGQSAVLSLFRKLRLALRPHGALVIVQIFLNDDLVSPHRAVLYSIKLIEDCPESFIPTISEMRELCYRSGFASIESSVLSSEECLLIASGSKEITH